MEEDKITQKLKELAKRVAYGNITVEFVINRGKIVKAIIKETKEVVLF